MGRPTVPDEADRQAIEAIHAARHPHLIADWLGAQIGGTVTKAETTESAYVRTDGQEIRLSNHSKYGSLQPMHVRCGVPAYQLIRRLRIAVIAARHGGSRNYRQVATLVEARERENFEARKTAYRDTRFAERELAGF